MIFDVDKNFAILMKMHKDHCRLEFETAARQQRVGSRHNFLPWLCRKGLEAGLTDAQIFETVMAHCGNPRLGDAEVWQGIAAARRPIGERVNKCERPATSEERLFVHNLIESGRGTTVEGLQKAAELQPTWENRGEALCRHIGAIIGKNRFSLVDKFFVGEKTSGKFETAFDLIHWKDDLCIPPLFTANAMTGEYAPKKDGSGMTLRGDNCVIAPKLMLLEFDEMSREDQLALVGGILKGTPRDGKPFLKPVSVVDSGNRSLHTLVEVEGDYADFKANIVRLFSSSNDSRECCDRAVLHPSALSRLAGAKRSETGRLQELIWSFEP